MSARIYEIPKSLVDLLKPIGPIHEETRADYRCVVRLVLADGNAPAGFIVEQRLVEPSAPVAEGQGMSFKVPTKPDARSEATFVFVETLADALEYIRRQSADAPPESR